MSRREGSVTRVLPLQITVVPFLFRKSGHLEDKYPRQRKADLLLLARRVINCNKPGVVARVSASCPSAFVWEDDHACLAIWSPLVCLDYQCTREGIRACVTADVSRRRVNPFVDEM